jgi:hypothetical protein
MRIDIQSSQEQLSSNKDQLREAEQNHRELYLAYDDIVFDQQLRGQGYYALVTRIESCDQPLSKGFISYTISMACLYEVQKEYISFFFSTGVSYLDSYEIEAQIAELKRRCDEVRDWLVRLQSTAIPPTDYASNVNYYLCQLHRLNPLIRELEDKLINMHKYEVASCHIYEDALAFAEVLKRGVRYSGSMIWQGGWQAQLGADDRSWQEDLATAADVTWWGIVSRGRPFIYADERGRYGGDQSGPRRYFNTPGRREQELVPILNQYPAFQGMTVPEQRYLLRKIEETGCGYVVIANSIIEQYYFRPEDFERDFGFPLFRYENGQRVVNHETLLVDLYCSNIDTLVAANGKAPADEYQGLSTNNLSLTMGNYLNDNTGGSQSVSVSCRLFDSSVDYTNHHEQGNVAVITTERTTYESNGWRGIGDETTTGGHAAMVTDVDNSGETPIFTVSTWGKKYTVTPELVIVIDWSTP